MTAFLGFFLCCLLGSLGFFFFVRGYYALDQREKDSAPLEGLFLMGAGGPSLFLASSLLSRFFAENIITTFLLFITIPSVAETIITRLLFFFIAIPLGFLITSIYYSKIRRRRPDPAATPSPEDSPTG